MRVFGTAGTAGSKTSGVAYRTGADGRSVPVTKADGRIVTFTNDSSGPKGKAWRSLVADAGAEAIAGFPLYDGPLYVEMTFLRPRGLGHYGTGRNAGVLRDSAPAYPSVRPDVLKHARAVEDALSGVVWRDDARICSGPNEKVYAGADEPSGVIVRVWALPATVGEFRAAEVVSAGAVAVWREGAA